MCQCQILQWDPKGEIFGTKEVGPIFLTVSPQGSCLSSSLAELWEKKTRNGKHANKSKGKGGDWRSELRSESSKEKSRKQWKQ